MSRKINEMVDGLCNSSNASSHPDSRSEQSSDDTSSDVVCTGVINFPNGDVYDGQLENGQRSGNGKMKFVNGDIYEGKWQANKMCNDDGVYTFKNGNEYRGGFKPVRKSKLELANVLFEGKGELKIAGLGAFIGQFKESFSYGPG